MLREVLEQHVAAEARPAGVELVGAEALAAVRDHDAEVLVAVFEEQVLAGVCAMTRPVEDHDGRALALADRSSREGLAGVVVLVPAEAVAEHDDALHRARVGAVQLAADATALLVDVEVCAHSRLPDALVQPSRPRT